MDYEGDVGLYWFLDLVRETREAGTSMTVEQSVAGIVKTIGNEWSTVILDVSLNGARFEEQVFDALISNEQIVELVVEADQRHEDQPMLPLVERALPQMTCLTIVSFMACPMTTHEAQRVFQSLGNVDTLSTVGFFPRSGYSTGVMAAFDSFVSTSQTLETLTLSWAYRDVVPMTSLQTFRSTCVAIGQSKSLISFHLLYAPVHETHFDAAADSLVEAIVNCETVCEVFSNDDDMSVEFMRVWHKALLASRAVKSFDLSVRETTSLLGPGVMLKLSRPSPWKPFLAQDVRLNVWPLILAETKFWGEKRSASHKNVDILFYLVKEKCDVLFQNTHRRRIRKRKRYGFDT